MRLRSRRERASAPVVFFRALPSHVPLYVSGPSARPRPLATVQHSMGYGGYGGLGAARSVCLRRLSGRYPDTYESGAKLQNSRPGRFRTAPGADPPLGARAGRGAALGRRRGRRALLERAPGHAAEAGALLALAFATAALDEPARVPTRNLAFGFRKGARGGLALGLTTVPCALVAVLLSAPAQPASACPPSLIRLHLDAALASSSALLIGVGSSALELRRARRSCPRWAWRSKTGAPRCPLHSARAPSSRPSSARCLANDMAVSHWEKQPC